MLTAQTFSQNWPMPGATGDMVECFYASDLYVLKCSRQEYYKEYVQLCG